MNTQTVSPQSASPAVATPSDDARDNSRAAPTVATMYADRVTIRQEDVDPQEDALLTLVIAPDATVGEMLGGLHELIDWVRTYARCHGHALHEIDMARPRDRHKSQARLLNEVESAALDAVGHPYHCKKQGVYESLGAFASHVGQCLRPQPGGYYACPWSGHTAVIPLDLRWAYRCPKELLELARRVGAKISGLEEGAVA